MDKCNYKYYFNFKPQIYEYLMRDILLNENKKEKTILTLLIKGNTCDSIGEEVGYSTRTIQRRKRDIFEKTKDLMI